MHAVAVRKPNLSNVSTDPNKTAAEGLGTFSVRTVHGVDLNDGNGRPQDVKDESSREFAWAPVAGLP